MDSNEEALGRYLTSLEEELYELRMETKAKDELISELLETLSSLGLTMRLDS